MVPGPSEDLAARGTLAAPATLTAPLRTLLLITAAMFTAFGAVLFVAPTWAAPRFPFEASPFAVMTAGSWFLGGAFLAWKAVRDERWSIVYPGVIYVAALPILEAGVFIMHLGDAQGSVVTWSYATVLAVGVVTAVAAGVEGARLRAERAEPVGRPVAIWVRVITGLFLAFDLRIAIPLLLGITRGGRIWPGELPLPVARAFGAFYLSIALAVLPLLVAKRTGPILWLMPGAIFGAVVITAPAIVYLELFDFDHEPGGLVYIGTYVVVFVVASVVLAIHRRAGSSEGSGLHETV
jgi:hypothetical protein